MDASSFHSPVAVFSGYRFIVSRRAAIFSSMGPFARNDLSLACNSSFSRRFRIRVNVPGLLLRSFRLPFLLPVRPFGSTTRSPVLAGSDCFLASGPLQFPRPASPAAHLFSLPFWDFSIPLDQHVDKFRCIPVRLPIPPDFLSLPVAFSLEWATDHRSWSATFPEALLFLRSEEHTSELQSH